MKIAKGRAKYLRVIQRATWRKILRQHEHGTWTIMTGDEFGKWIQEHNRNHSVEQSDE